MNSITVFRQYECKSMESLYANAVCRILATLFLSTFFLPAVMPMPLFDVGRGLSMLTAETWCQTHDPILPFLISFTLSLRTRVSSGSQLL